MLWQTVEKIGRMACQLLAASIDHSKSKEINQLSGRMSVMRDQKLGTGESDIEQDQVHT